MPKAQLIFFPEPVELTDAQLAEAKALGHLRDDGSGDAEAGPYTPPGTGYPGGYLEPGDNNSDPAGGEPGGEDESSEEQ